MFDDDKKSNIDILSKKAKIEKVSILREFSRILEIVKKRETKLEDAKKALSGIGIEIRDLEEKNALVAHFGGDGKLLHRFIQQKNQLEKTKEKLEVRLQDLTKELNLAEAKFEEVKKNVVSFTAKNTIIDEKLETLKIEEIESRIYQEEISYQEDNPKIKK